MLNRRLLRAKALQLTYAFFTVKEARKSLALDKAVSVFEPDLNSMQPLDTEELKGKRALAKLLFEEWVVLPSPSPEEDSPQDVKQAVWSAIEAYRKGLAEDSKSLLKFANRDFEAIDDMVVVLLELLALLATEAARRMEDPKQIVSSPYSLSHWCNNPLITAIHASLPVASKVTRSHLDRSDLQALATRMYRDALLPDATFAAYCALPEVDVNQHKEAALHVLKQIVFKHKDFQAFAGEHDMHWEFDTPVVRSLASLALKDWQQGAEIKIPEKSPDWEADLQFFTALFSETCSRADSLDEYIAAKLKNWKLDRLNVTDEALIKLALVEMTHFSSIPVKVSINEYVELAKVYSTPKSKQFVNGMLDAISLEWVQKGMIKKSGRGLIDNKL
jgi:N utilization substance protein B